VYTLSLGAVLVKKLRRQTPSWWFECFFVCWELLALC
jgi:hypothetical protein